MTKRISTQDLATLVEKGFAALAEDISKLATKTDAALIHTQVNSIERQLREFNPAILEARVTDLEEEVFGASRS